MSGSWDEICHRCGLCCFEKFENDNGTVFYTQSHCRYLDVVTRECRVYHNRFLINPECIKLTPELVEKLHWLPKECGYRQKLKTEDDES